MTEAEWLALTAPEPMLKFLRRRASDRKLRLFACACCRLVWDRLTGRGSRRAVEVAERYADGEAKAGRLSAACSAIRGAEVRGAEGTIRFAVVYLAQRDAGYMIRNVLGEPRRDWGDNAPASQAALLRDLLGNPFRPVSLRPAWLTRDVRSLARAAYDNRTLPAGTLEPERLGLLADALEDAGCHDADFLGHLRSEGPHVRGCWAVDLLLSKE
jgi:hypothetical protein